jgi:hypothetical protein
MTRKALATPDIAAGSTDAEHLLQALPTCSERLSLYV